MGRRDKVYTILATLFIGSIIFAVFVILACLLQMVLPWML